MRIGVDARVVKKYPGLGRYCVNILRALSVIDRENEYVIFTLLPDKFRFLENCSNFKVVEVDCPVLSYKTFYSFSKFVNAYRPDIFLSSFQVAPLRVACPMVIVLHDMMDLMYKDAFTHHNLLIRSGLKSFFRFAIPRSVNRADAIITVSESTKKDVISYFGLSENKVTAILEGVEKSFRPIVDGSSLEAVRKKYCLPEKFILYLGSIKPYKNLHGVLRAFHLFHKTGIDQSIRLVICGLKHFSLQSLEAEIDSLGLEHKVIRVGFIAEEDLPAVYSLAEVFLFPSIWEGFGLPALEAMACGTPVIASNTSSLPEVVGDAGVLVDPHDADQIAKGLISVAVDPELRLTLSRKGVERAKKFSWEEAARDTLRVLLEVYGNRDMH